MTDREAVDVVRSAVAVLNGGDMAGYLSYFDPSCPRWIGLLNDTVPLTVVADGLRDLRASFEPLELEEEALFGDETFACARWRLRGVHQREFMGMEASGVAIDVPTCEIYEVRDGRITYTWTYGDPMAMLAQISPGTNGS